MEWFKAEPQVNITLHNNCRDRVMLDSDLTGMDGQLEQD